MLFNSYDFLWFFPLSLLIYWMLNARLRLQNAWLLVASYIFYAWWDIRFLSLIAAITLVAYACAIVMERKTATPGSRRAALTLGISVSVGVLCIFKYYNFFATEAVIALHSVGLSVALPLLRVALPVGISFYTFQVVGYMVDVYRRQIRASRDVVSFAAFVSFFPQLVAGPIERAGRLLSQIERPRTLTTADITVALRLMLWGFTKKMLLADTCAPIVNTIYANPDATAADLWTAVILFAFQIYGDFSGYSDIAVGAARLFGIRLSTNFRLPYFAESVPDFWRRWHITLMTWFKDYIYIPLGGSRCSKSRWVANLTCVFLLSGIWHGANWTFVAWGLFQLIGYVPAIVRKGKNREKVAEKKENVLKIIATFVFACVGWVFFRSESVGAAVERIVRMFTESPLDKPCCGLRVFLTILFVVACEWLMRRRQYTLDLPQRGPLRWRAVRWTIYYALIFAIFYWGGSQTAFIYFQF